MSGSDDNIPKINQPILNGFRWFARRYVRKHFHTVACNAQSLLSAGIEPQDSIVVYANHASWWDPLSAMLLHDSYLRPTHQMYAPIDAAALAQYQMFAKMGFFGVDQSSRQGAIEFLRRSTAILERTGNAIWLTPEGRFVDPRETDAELQAGISHLAARISQDSANSIGHKVWFLPGAVEYVFWEERKPELLCWFGEPLLVTDSASASDQAAPAEGKSESLAESKKRLHAELSKRLRDAQALLRDRSVARDASAFEVLLDSSSGTFFIYDWWRAATGRLRGRVQSADHSQLWSDSAKSKRA